MSLSSKKVLVTGADGFIGSHLVEELVRRGADVRAFAMYNSFNSWGWLDYIAPDIRDSLDVVMGDIRDPYGVRQAMGGREVVFHLAALIAIPFSYHSPDAYVDTNIKGTLNVLQAARDFELEKVVQTSTSEVYGTARFVPITEEHPLQGQSPYAATKIGADQLALSFNRSFGLPVAVIRPFNTYGPRQSARAVIPTIITQLAKGANAIRLGATEPTRDFNFVTDVVAGFISIAESSRSIGEVINIGSGFEISIGNLARLISKLMVLDVEIRCEQERLRPDGSEVERLLADNNKARTLLGWSPLYAGEQGLQAGLRETIAWFKQPENLSGYKAHLYNL